MQDFPWWVRLIGGLAPRLGLNLMALLWRPPRWVCRQQVCGHTRRTLYQLAHQFARDNFAAIHPREVGDFLVRAFLEDLRRAHRRNTPGGRGRRRTGYPILLLDGATDGTAGATLITAIGRVRNASTIGDEGRRVASPGRLPDKSDPLLVIAAGHGLPNVIPCEPADARTSYLDWIHQLRNNGRSRRWVLAFNADPTLSVPGTADRLTRLGLMHIRPALGAPAMVAVLMTGLLSVPFVNQDRCVDWWSPDLLHLVQGSPLQRVDDQCIGISDDPLRDFPLPAQLRKDNEEVAKGLERVYGDFANSNDEVVGEKWGMTLVYFGVFTPKDTRNFAPLLEDLRGLQIKQAERNGNSGGGRKLRVLFANGGEAMAQGQTAAERIRMWARREPQLAAVVGIPLSNKDSKKAINTLGGEGRDGTPQVPMVSMQASADSMAEDPFYHQVAPNNRREAAVAAHFAKTILQAEKVLIYSSGDQEDYYSTNLAEDVGDEFESRGMPVLGRMQYQIDDLSPNKPSILSLGQQVYDRVSKDSRGTVVFYAGRSEYLAEFLRGISSGSAGSPSTLPIRVIADDSAGRFILDKENRKSPGIDLYYLSFATPAAWSTPTLDIDIYKQYKDKYGKTGAGMDGRAALAYDAAMVAADACARPTQNIRECVEDGILSKTFNGMSGVIRFNGDENSPERRVPSKKAVVVMKANETGPTPVMLCGELRFANKLAQELKAQGETSSYSCE